MSILILMFAAGLAAAIEEKAERIIKALQYKEPVNHRARQYTFN